MIKNGTDTEKDIINTWIQPLQIDLNSGGISQLPPDGHDESWGALAGLFTLPEELRDNVFSWGKDLIYNDGFEFEQEGEAAREGYAYYNGVLLPELPVYDTSLYQCITIFYNPGYDSYNLFLSSSPMIEQASSDSSTSVVSTFEHDCTYTTYSYINSYTSWSGRGEPYSGSCGSGWNFSDVIYCNYNYGKYVGPLGGLTSVSPNRGILHSPGIIKPFYTENVPISPSIYVGDIPNQVKDGSFDEEKYQLPLINPDTLWTGQTDAIQALNDTATKLQDGTMTYDQYMDKIQTESNTGSGSDSPGSNAPNDLGYFTLDLRQYFPFCIPFDLYDFFACLAADPVAPVINWELPLPGGEVYPIEIDLSIFDPVAQLLRRLELLLFVVGLAIKTRDLIKG